MTEIPITDATAYIGNWLGLMDWCGDAWELTPKGELWLSAWCARKIAEAAA